MTLAQVWDAFARAEREEGLMDWRVAGVYVWPAMKTRLLRQFNESLGLIDETDKQPSVFDIENPKDANTHLVAPAKTQVAVVPFVPQEHYDPLLWACDINFVRGEDSFVRAQWAGEAMLWHIYRQDEDAHLIKLAAWQQRVETVAAAANTPMPASWGQMLMTWNHPATSADACSSEDWLRFFAELHDIRAALQSWRQHLLAQPDLATQLMRFYADRVESRPK